MAVPASPPSLDRGRQPRIGFRRTPRGSKEASYGRHRRGQLRPRQRAAPRGPGRRAGVAVHALCDGGLVIDLSEMKRSTATSNASRSSTHGDDGDTWDAQGRPKLSGPLLRVLSTRPVPECSEISRNPREWLPRTRRLIRSACGVRRQAPAGAAAGASARPSNCHRACGRRGAGDKRPSPSSRRRRSDSRMKRLGISTSW
jgi:hypothetical protein